MTYYYYRYDPHRYRPHAGKDVMIGLAQLADRLGPTFLREYRAWLCSREEDKARQAVIGAYLIDRAPYWINLTSLDEFQAERVRRQAVMQALRTRSS